MKKLLCIATIAALMAPFVIAEETSACKQYYRDVKRKVGNLEKKDLSNLAKETLFSSVNLDFQLCMESCEGYKFDYCNDVAKELEKK